MATPASFLKVVKVTAAISLDVYIPPNTPAGAKLPAFVGYPGMGEAGKIDAMDVHGAMHFLMEGSTWRPAFIIIYVVSTNAFPDPAEVDGTLNFIVSNLPVDPNRIYGLGFSAGSETLSLYAEEKPEFSKRFAAMILMSITHKPCDYYRDVAAKAANIDLVPLWQIQGMLDTSPHSFAVAKRMNDAMKEKGRKDVFFTPIPNTGHTPVNPRFDPAYRDPVLLTDIYTWALKYTRAAAPVAPKAVNRITITTFSDGTVDIKKEVL